MILSILLIILAALSFLNACLSLWSRALTKELIRLRQKRVDKAYKIAGHNGQKADEKIIVEQMGEMAEFMKGEVEV